MFIAQICKVSSLKKKIRLITLIVWMQGRVEKKAKKCEKYYCFAFIKCQSVTHVSTSIFQGLFRNIVFRSVALITKKFKAIKMRVLGQKN